MQPVKPVNDDAGRAGTLLWLSPQVRERLVFLPVAAVMIVAGGLVATVNGATAFKHGSWLAAYLVLVGGVAQLILGFGSLLLPRARCPLRLRRAQLLLWNVGTLAVAGGVLGNAFAVVLGGSIVTAAALVSFAAGTGPLSAPGRRGVLIYRLVVAVLVISVLVGGSLAHGGYGN